MRRRFNAPLVSVIIPVYNTESYLHECLDSVINQTLRDIEVICINDCSTDGSLSILKEYQTRDKRIKIVNKLVNEGLATARNNGIEVASGKYIIFVDSDDYVDSELCKKALECAEKTDSDLVIYDYISFWRKEHIVQKQAKESLLLSINPSNKAALLNINHFAWTKLIRLEHLQSIKLRFLDGLFYEDSPFHWSLIIDTPRIAILPERLYFYRQRRNSICYSNDWKLIDRILVYDRIKNFLLRKSLYQDYSDIFLKQQLSVFFSVYNNVDELNRSTVLAMIKERMTDEHWQYILKGKQLTWRYRDFFKAMKGDKFAKLRWSFWLLVRRCYQFCKKLF